MTPGSGAHRRQCRTSGAHRAPRKRSALTRTVAAGGAVVCIGAAYEATAPTVHALSIVFYNPQANGTTNELRVDLAQNNIFDPQLGILESNDSNNSTTGNGAIGTSNNFLVNNPIVNNPITRLLSSLWNREIVFGNAGAGPVNNITQISLASFNIFNPQASIFGGNLSHNTTNSNIAVGYGNDGNTSATSVPNLWTSWLGGMTGNGNAHQLAFLSGNIFNPQWSLSGPNVSNNTATTNVADNNGNYSQTSVMQGGGLLGAVVRLFLGGTTGNGNTSQTAVGTSNIANPQISIGGSNESSNTATTNEAVGNGNNSQTTAGAPNGSGNVIATGTTGNGNTSQTAVGTSNTANPQISIGGSNESGNTATTNEAVGNGNNSQTTAGAPNGSGNVIATGTTGNGNTTQTAVDASNIENPQVSLANVGHGPTSEHADNPDSAPMTTSTSTASKGTPASGSTAAITANTVSANPGSYSGSFSPSETGTHSATGSSDSPTPQSGERPSAAGSIGASKPSGDSSGSGSSGDKGNQ
jgi:hypothetical protein